MQNKEYEVTGVKMGTTVGRRFLVAYLLPHEQVQFRQEWIIRPAYETRIDEMSATGGLRNKRPVAYDSEQPTPGECRANCDIGG